MLCLHITRWSRKGRGEFEAVQRAAIIPSTSDGLFYFTRNENIKHFQQQRVVSECTVWMLSGWVVATREETLRLRIYRTPRSNQSPRLWTVLRSSPRMNINKDHSVKCRSQLLRASGQGVRPFAGKRICNRQECKYRPADVQARKNVVRTRYVAPPHSCILFDRNSW
jgi:hypothetical protein